MKYELTHKESCNLTYFNRVGVSLRDLPEMSLREIFEMTLIKKRRKQE